MKKLYRQIENSDYYVAEDGTVMISEGYKTTRLVESGSQLVRPEDMYENRKYRGKMV